MHYKIIKEDKVVDVVKNPDFIIFLPYNHVSMTDKSNAQGIVASDGDTIYSFDFQRKDIPIASIKEIDHEEFSRLKVLLNSEQVISADESALAKAKQTVINRLSNICRTSIVSGFAIKLSDGKLHSFKLTTEDQLNLMMIEQQLSMGVESFVYHATNQPCKIFSKADMTAIILAFRQHTLYHTTYFNAAKHYIMSLVDIEKVNLFTYGDDVADFVDDPVLKQILRTGGGNR